MPFALDAKLAADTLPIGDLPLCRALLMNDARYPWIILVPRRAATTEIHELDAARRAALIEETAGAAKILKQVSGAKKINIGALGNIVTQLHVHVVARFVEDEAWPGPVWGQGAARPYSAAAAKTLVDALAKALDAGPCAV